MGKRQKSTKNPDCCNLGTKNGRDVLLVATVVGIGTHEVVMKGFRVKFQAGLLVWAML